MADISGMPNIQYLSPASGYIIKYLVSLMKYYKIFFISNSDNKIFMAGLAGIMSKKKADEANKGALIKAKWGAVAPQQKKP